MSCNKGYFVGGLFVGTIIGGALGILLAPSSGEETRRKIKDGAQDTFGDAYDQARLLTPSTVLKTPPKTL